MTIIQCMERRRKLESVQSHSHDHLCPKIIDQCWPGPKRSICSTYWNISQFAKPLIQIAGPKNIQHNPKIMMTIIMKTTMILSKWSPVHGAREKKGLRATSATAPTLCHLEHTQVDLITILIPMISIILRILRIWWKLTIVLLSPCLQTRLSPDIPNEVYKVTDTNI